MSVNSVASSGGGSEELRQAELEIDELERRRHSNRYLLPATFLPPAPARPSTSAHAQETEEMDVQSQGGAAAVDAQYNNDNPIGLYGWRKRCLYFFVLLLVVIIITNLALTIWILVVLDFSQHGMGNLRILKSGIRLEGTAEFLGPLYARNISADQDSTLQLQSQSLIDLSIVGGGAEVTLDNSTLNITTQLFQVATPSSLSQLSPALSVSDDGISVGASQMEITGTLGMILNGPVETAQISSHPSEDLHLESASGSMAMIGRGGVRIEDGPGLDGVEITSNEQVSIASRSGAVVLDAEIVRLPGLPRAASAASSVYEVCACESGQLYLAPATAGGAACSTHNNICTTT